MALLIYVLRTPAAHGKGSWGYCKRWQSELPWVVMQVRKPLFGEKGSSGLVKGSGLGAGEQQSQQGLISASWPPQVSAPMILTGGREVEEGCEADASNGQDTETNSADDDILSEQVQSAIRCCSCL